MTNELTDLTNIPAPTLTLDPVSDGEVAEASIIEVDSPAAPSLADSLSAEELASGELKLRVFVDRGCVEVYVNDGRQAMSSFSYASEGPHAIKLVAESGTLKVKSLVLHHMKSIGLE